MERCEDLGEKLDNLEKMNNARRLRECLRKWNDIAKNNKKNDALKNLANKIAEVFNKKKKEKNEDTYNELKDKLKEQEDAMNEKIKDFQKKQAQKKFINHLNKAHKLNKILNDVKKKLDDRHKRDVLNKLKDNEKKSKMEYFVDKMDNFLIEKQKKDNLDAKKKLMDNLKEVRDQQIKLEA